MVLLNAFATPLMISATNVALPAIADDLGLGAVALAWVPMALLMASAMCVLAFGSVADRVGRKRIFLLGTGVVLIASSLAALAVDAGTLIAARLLQGIGAAMLYATQIALVSSVFPAQRRGQVVGLVVAAIYIGLAAGPLLGGYINDMLGWRFTFLLQVPLALLVLVVGIWRVPQEWRVATTAPFDTTGALLYAAGIALVCIAVTRLPALQGFTLLASGLFCIAAFIRHARQTPHPIWDVKLFFGNRLFTLSCAAALLMYGATYANVVLLSLYLQYLKALPATAAGMLMMVQPLTMALLSPLAGRLSDRLDPRVLPSLGLAATAIGLALLASLNAASSLTKLVLALLLTGIGFSLFSSPNVNTIMGAVPPRHLGSAAGAVATTRLLGQLGSMAVVSLMLALFIGDEAIGVVNYPQLERAIRVSFSLAALLCLPAIVFSLVRGGKSPAPGANL